MAVICSQKIRNRGENTSCVNGPTLRQAVWEEACFDVVNYDQMAASVAQRGFLLEC